MIEIPCKVGYIDRFKINPSLFNDEKMLYDEESDHSYKAVRTCHQNSDG